MSDAGKRTLLPGWPCSHQTKPQLCWAGFVSLGMCTCLHACTSVYMHAFVCVYICMCLGIYMCVLCGRCVFVCFPCECGCMWHVTNSSVSVETPEASDWPSLWVHVKRLSTCWHGLLRGNYEMTGVMLHSDTTKSLLCSYPTPGCTGRYSIRDTKYGKQFIWSVCMLKCKLNVC